MAKTDVLDILRAKKMSPMEFNFESLMIPPMGCYLTPQDVDALRTIATSVRLSSKIHQKYKMIDDIMRPRGFKRFSAGTNRIVYSFLEDTRFLVKIAVDKVGMQDNPMEYKNQFLLKPFVTKMFYVSPCGTVGFAERVLPIKNKIEFKQIASDVFDIAINKILGEYVVEDIGTKYFMNWGIRLGFGPVLLDYPYVYKLDGKKLFCTRTDPLTMDPCNGEIDYDVGFNHLVCTKCGKTYLATNLRDDNEDNKIIIKGGIQMRVVIKKGDQIVTPIPVDEVMQPPARPIKKNTNLVVGIKRANHITIIKDGTNDEECPNTPDTIIHQDIDNDNIVSPDTNINSDDNSVKDDNIASCVDNSAKSDNSDNAVYTTNGESTGFDEEVKQEESIIETNDETVEVKPHIISKPRDAKGRYISTGKHKDGNSNNKIKSSFIPSKD